jgi:hypothetical protein
MSDVLDVTNPSILGAETFAYATDYSQDYAGPIGFKRESSGALELMQFGAVGPPLNGGSYTLQYPDASPAGNYVVFQMFPNDANPFQVGSYTVNSDGSVSTTNTSSNMPTSGLLGASSTFSPSGNMLVLYADNGYNQNQQLVEGGIEIYNFNGAAPLTLYKKLLTGTSIDQVAWDSSNHLYAISKSTNELYVFTVTPTSEAEDTSWSIGSPFLMAVVSQTPTSGACSAPSSDGVNVCSPSNGATVTSPVQVNAAATVSGGVYRFELWNGSTKLLSVDNGIMDQSLSLAPGSYHLTFDARNSSGTHEYATREITVQ